MNRPGSSEGRCNWARQLLLPGCVAGNIRPLPLLTCTMGNNRLFQLDCREWAYHYLLDYMQLNRETTNAIDHYIRGHFQEWMSQFGAVSNSSEREMEIRERIVRVEESLERQSALMRQGFEQIDKRFEQVDKRFEQVDKRFEQVDKRFEELREDTNKRFEQVDKRFEELREDTNRRFEQVDRRFEQVDKHFGRVYGFFIGLFVVIIGGFLIQIL